MRPDPNSSNNNNNNNEPDPSTTVLEDDEEGWQDMPVIRSEDDPYLDEEDQKRFHYVPEYDHSRPSASSNATGNQIHFVPNNKQQKQKQQQLQDVKQQQSSSSSSATLSATASKYDPYNHHQHILSGASWREKSENLEETDYTRLELDEDRETDEVHLRTEYLFNENDEMTALSQMSATKNLLTEAQRIAYVGLCRLITREMVQEIRRRNAQRTLEPAAKSIDIWAQTIMKRLYVHMNISTQEQMMIELLGEHGLASQDLVPSLRTTHTVPNPDYEPDESKREKRSESFDNPFIEENDKDDDKENNNDQVIPTTSTTTTATTDSSALKKFKSNSSLNKKSKGKQTTYDDSIDVSKIFSDNPISTTPDSTPTPSSSRPDTPKLAQQQQEKKLGQEEQEQKEESQTSSLASQQQNTESTDNRNKSLDISSAAVDSVAQQIQDDGDQDTKEQIKETIEPFSTALPGVSTSLTDADETVTLDIRWTILCDLFLTLISDGTYDARSRVLIGKVAQALSLTWMDVVRFERRLTEALEIQEGVAKGDTTEAMEARKRSNKNKRIMMMGLAGIGGGLVIGLSAGILAPLIGAGLGAAFTTVGITGTATFLGGTGGAAVITTTGVMTGTALAGKGMAKRTRNVSHFEFKPIHNNRRVSAWVAVGGFMEGSQDDVRLPFSVLDPIIGDVFSILWEPQMMKETGYALRILTSEVLTQVGQQVLAATVMASLMSALQWPLILTKLSYLIDNPWSNALDRARAAGGVLADILKHKQLGDRPISLVGYSLGARAIFYCMLELSKAKAFGLIQDVYLIGTTVSVPLNTWNQMRAAAAGRVVNVYAKNDWLLAYLFRVSQGGMATVAGLRPVIGANGIENFDVSDLVTGHMSYRSLMPKILDRIGFRVTADHFDEPEDFDAEIEEEELRKAGKSTRSYFWKFGANRRRKRKDTSNNSNNDNQDEEKEEDEKEVKDEDDYDYDYDDEDQDGDQEKEQQEKDIRKKQDKDGEHGMTAREQPVAPTKAGFDLDELRKELEKVEALSDEQRMADSLPTDEEAPKKDSSSNSPNPNSNPNSNPSPNSDPNPNQSSITASTANDKMASPQEIKDSKENDKSRKITTEPNTPTLTFGDASGNINDNNINNSNPNSNPSYNFNSWENEDTSSPLQLRSSDQENTIDELSIESLQPPSSSFSLTPLQHTYSSRSPLPFEHEMLAHPPSSFSSSSTASPSASPYLSSTSTSSSSAASASVFSNPWASTTNNGNNSRSNSTGTSGYSTPILPQSSASNNTSTWPSVPPRTRTNSYNYNS